MLFKWDRLLQEEMKNEIYHRLLIALFLLIDSSLSVLFGILSKRVDLKKGQWEGKLSSGKNLDSPKGFLCSKWYS